MQGLLRRRGWTLLSFTALFIGLIACVLLARNVAQAQPNVLDAWDCLYKGGSGPWLGHCPERVPVKVLDGRIRTGMMVSSISDLRSVTGTLEFDPRYLEILGTGVDRVRNDPCAVAPNLAATPDNNAGTLGFAVHFDPPLGDGCTMFLIDWRVKEVSPSGVITPTFSLHTMVDSQGQEIPHHTKPLTGGCVVTGTVQLKGRRDHSGTEVMLSPWDGCPKNWDYRSLSYLDIISTTTDSRGNFTLTSGGAPCLCLFAYKQGYLSAQGKPPMEGPVFKAPIKLLGGDATGDDAINIFDLALIGKLLYSHDPVCDINGDNECNILDLTIAAGDLNTARGPQDWP